LRYREVESVLARIMNVKATDLGAFRARLRHLRNIGLPRLPKIGSGKAIDYSTRHALELLLALELEDAGQNPSDSAAVVAASLIRQSPRGEYRDSETYACIRKGELAYAMIHGKKAFMEFLDKAPDTFLIINITGCEKKLNAALKAAAPVS
jgi:hypothetical protein